LESHELGEDEGGEEDEMVSGHLEKIRKKNQKQNPLKNTILMFIMEIGKI
jgi:hypothetical protein